MIYNYRGFKGTHDTIISDDYNICDVKNKIKLEALMMTLRLKRDIHYFTTLYVLH